MPFISSVCAGSRVERADVGAVVDRRKECGHGLAGVLEQIAAMQFERTLIHPHQRGFDALGHRCRRLRRRRSDRRG